ATGKSTVSEILTRLGCVLIDADQLAREVVAPGGPALAEVVREFGDVLQPDGALDRKKLAASAFADPARRKRLEAIRHPAIRRRRGHRGAHARGVRGAGARPRGASAWRAVSVTRSASTSCAMRAWRARSWTSSRRPPPTSRSRSGPGRGR